MAVVEQKVDSGRNASSVGDASEDEQVEQGTRDCLVDGSQGWANVFAKVLTQNPKVKKSKKTLVLVKAKKDAELERQRQAKESKGTGGDAHKAEPLKIVDKQGNVIDEEEHSLDEDHEDDASSTDSDSDATSKKIGTLEKMRIRKQRMELGLIVPQAGDPYEKNLLRTATKGVIQLFNAVNKFQEEKKKSMRKDESSDEDEGRYKKGRFMETLTKLQEKNRKNEGAQATSKWEALREDFMTNSKMRDWDKQDEASDEDGEDRG